MEPFTKSEIEQWKDKRLDEEEVDCFRARAIITIEFYEDLYHDYRMGASAEAHLGDRDRAELRSCKSEVEVLREKISSLKYKVAEISSQLHLALERHAKSKERAEMYKDALEYLSEVVENIEDERIIGAALSRNKKLLHELLEDWDDRHKAGS